MKLLRGVCAGLVILAIAPAYAQVTASVLSIASPLDLSAMGETPLVICVDDAGAGAGEAAHEVARQRECLRPTTEG